MNKIEREKVTALQACRMACFCKDRLFVRNMAWARDNDSKKVLTPRQKWFLDVLVYKYRRQLGGRELGFAIPSEPPVAADYGVREDTGAKQKNIFGGEDTPRRTPVDPPDRTPQRELF